MHAIFVGSITSGFLLVAVMPEAEAAAYVAKSMSTGTFAEAVPIIDPSERIKSFKNKAEGDHFVVFGYGLASGFEVVGPFEEFDDAEALAEAGRKEEEDWQIFILATEATSA